jgi:signal transduction histidine kinase
MKMAENLRKLLAVVLIAVAPIAVFAQDAEQATKEALDKLDQMSVEVNSFVGDVRFNERDVKSLIDLWEEYSEIGENEYESEEDIEFESILNDDRYLQWAESHSLDADDWARKTVRITMMLYREQMLEAANVMPEQMAQQMAMIEEQREQLGEEMYQQIKQGMEESAQYGKAVAENARSLPQPTAAEQAILDKYRAELMMLMESDDEDEDEYYGDDDYYEDEEYDEEDEY